MILESFFCNNLVRTLIPIFLIAYPLALLFRPFIKKLLGDIIHIPLSEIVSGLLLLLLSTILCFLMYAMY